MARSYIKIYGPPLLKGLRALEHIAVEMSEEITIRFFSSVTPTMPYSVLEVYSDEELSDMLLPEVPLPISEKVKLISSSSQILGDYDFFFEWGREPSLEQVMI